MNNVAFTNAKSLLRLVFNIFWVSYKVIFELLEFVPSNVEISLF